MSIPFKALMELDRQAARAVVCLWCEDSNDTNRWCFEHDLKTTHNMCPQCKAVAKAQEKARRASREPFPPSA